MSAQFRCSTCPALLQKSPLFQCRKGHLICEGCSNGSSRKCTENECDAEVDKARRFRNRFMETLMDKHQGILDSSDPATIFQRMADEDIKIMECPVCLGFPEDEAWQCVHGHVICARCLSEIVADCPQLLCPTCRTPMDDPEGKGRNLILEKVLDQLLVDCPHSEKGCNAKVKRGELNQHVTLCKYAKEFSLCKLIGFRECRHTIHYGNTAATAAHFQCIHRKKIAKLAMKNPACFVDHLLNFFQVKSGFFSSPFALDKPRDNLIYVASIRDEYLSWYCFNLNLEEGEQNDTTAVAGTSSAAPPQQRMHVRISLSRLYGFTEDFVWRVPVVNIMNADKLLKNPKNASNRTFIPALLKRPEKQGLPVDKRSPINFKNLAIVIQ